MYRLTLYVRRYIRFGLIMCIRIRAVIVEDEPLAAQYLAIAARCKPVKE